MSGFDAAVAIGGRDNAPANAGWAGSYLDTSADVQDDALRQIALN